MSYGFFSCNLCTFDNNEPQIISMSLSYFITFIQITYNHIFKRTIFNMVCNSYSIQPLLPRLIDSHVRPYSPIRKNRMNVKVTFQHFISIEAWNINIFTNIFFPHFR